MKAINGALQNHYNIILLNLTNARKQRAKQHNNYQDHNITNKPRPAYLDNNPYKYQEIELQQIVGPSEDAAS